MPRALGLLILAAATLSSGPARADSCGDLRGRHFGDAAVRSTTWVADEPFKAPDGKTYDHLPAFCRVVLTATPSPVSNITIEVWLPAAADWNGKILATGNGGFAGALWYFSLASSLRRGFVAAHTDMGTFPADLFSDKAYEAGVGHPEMVKDWGFRATHEMALAAKAMTAAYYGRPQARSYFMGCSTGGHQALMEAQRFPADFDGIIAGAPGHNRTHLHAAFVEHFQTELRHPDAFATAAKIDVITRTLRERCGDHDGGAPGDTFLNDPGPCEFDLAPMRCGPDVHTECLTDAEIESLESLRNGTRNPRTHALIYPRWAPEGIAAMLPSYARPHPDRTTAHGDGLLRWVFGAAWDSATFDFDRDMARVDDALAQEINAMDTDLSEFATRGGKLILYHGWADPIVSPLDTIVYFDRLNAVDPGTGLGSDPPAAWRFARLFMVPGMSHCTGGPAPDQFGGMFARETSTDPDRDMVSALDRWVETDHAPERIVATRPARDNVPALTRPLCAYPKIARYDGTGNPADAASFTCVDGPPVHIEAPATEYLR